MKRCKTCKHWLVDNEGRGCQITKPEDQDTFELMEMPFEVRECKHPKLLFCERPVENPGFAIADGSTYFAAFYPTEDFGCVLHEDVVDAPGRSD